MHKRFYIELMLNHINIIINLHNINVNIISIGHRAGKYVTEVILHDRDDNEVWNKAIDSINESLHKIDKTTMKIICDKFVSNLDYWDGK